MKVYRVENQEGKGPYCAPNPMYLCDNNVVHPCPTHDSKLMINAMKKGVTTDLKYFPMGSDWQFGFESVKQFKRWFYSNKILQDFDEYHFTLNVYEASAKQVALGNTQLVFLKNNATLIGKRPFTKYLDR